MARVRTLNFLPEIFQTPTNAEFLAATLDQIVSNPATAKVQGYIGSRFGSGVNALDYYVTEPTKTRADYQLEPGVVFTKKNESIAQDFIAYPGMVDAIKIKGGITNNNNRLFQSEIYSWDSFTNLDKLVNYQEYYWLPNGPPAVTVSNSVIFTNEDYVVVNYPNAYEIAEVGSQINTGVNPTISLLRGGTYTFSVNQEAGFWIQTEPGVTGFSSTQPNIPIREIFGVEDNGTNNGVVTFRVPQKNAQDQYIFPGNNVVDVVSTLPFNQINGQRLYTITDPETGITYPGLGNIDGVSGLNGLRVMFYNNGVPDEIGYVSSYYDESFYDLNDPFFTDPETVVVSSTTAGSNALTLGAGYTTDKLIVNQTVTFSGSTLGGLVAGQVYFVKEILNSTEFTLSLSIEGDVVPVYNQSGINMVTNINQGQFEQGFYTTVNENFYRIQFVGDPNNPILRLIPDGSIPNNQKITPKFGTEWINRPFYRNTLGVISLVPQITAPLDVLYYQDATNPNKVGVIKIVENIGKDFLDIDTEILGKINYTSPNGVAFTNGLKVQFDGNVFPMSYRQGEYYVEGVGTAIELIAVTDLQSPENFTVGDYIPWDTLGFDVGNYDINLYIPVEQDYITIARNSISKNAWSRSNRWFHEDVIAATANYNNNNQILTEFATLENKAKRPIIEFYPNLRLFNSGATGKRLVDFYDTVSTDALSNVAGLNNYYPDVETRTSSTAVVSPTPVTIVNVADMVVGETYVVHALGTTSQSTWNTIAGTEGVVYVAGDKITCVVDASGSTGTGQARVLYDTTTIIVPLSDVTGIFQIGMFVGDTLDILPVNAQIIGMTDDGTTLTLTVHYPYPQDIAGGTSAIVGTDTVASNYSLFSGARIVFAADQDENVRNKVYVANIISVNPGAKPTIVLSEAEDGLVEVDQQVAITRGYNYQGYSFFYDGVEWKRAQQKVTVNQAPLFDIFDDNGISLGDPDVYNSTTFKGCTLFSYGINPLTVDDPILGFPIRYSDISNIGDISFDVTLNSDTFDYVRGFEPVTEQVNIGYVHNTITNLEFERQLGWQTSVEPSAQYQVFNFKYDITNPTAEYVCDIQVLPDLPVGEKGWPRVQVYYNNVYQEPANYSVTIYSNGTGITLTNPPKETTVIQVLLLSDQVSNNAYYLTPSNLNNNPLNADLTVTDLGDIRNQYQDIFINAPNTTGQIFGKNNYRDAGNLVPYGSKIIQNSASLVLPGTFLRKANHDLIDALSFNSKEYVKYRQLLVDTVQNTEYVQRFTPAQILDDAIDQIAASKSEVNAFFWSDMVPSKSPFRVSTYTFKSNTDVTRYPLSKVYNFSSANYESVLVYLDRTVNGVYTQTQLLKNIDYTISEDSPSLTVTLDLIPGDQITVKEYNQTYGSYVPYTPSKLGIYPLSQPQVVLDVNYATPTYFIKGHDGSYTKLYGEYLPETDTLLDFRDQALLEFEKRVFNNFKVSAELPIKLYDVLPGFFRESTYSYDEWLQMYSTNFLNWVGQNRVDYKTQLFNRVNEFTYNYSNAGNKLNGSPIQQGYWRGVYEYMYDTSTPNTTPWEMLGFANKPTWWEDRYGPAPYTSDNLVLWADLEAGLVYNDDGTSTIVPEVARPGLSQIIPVDTAGNLLSPLNAVVGNYNSNIFQKDWKVGDDAPVELSYRRSSTYPFDLMKIVSLMKPAEFYNLAVDLDNYKYSAEFNQYLVNNRSHLVISDVEVYGNGIAKTSYLNWIVDYEKQLGIDATSNIKTLLANLDVRLIYRLAGYSDKTLLQFYVEKGSPNSTNASLLIPDESYSILLYDNQPFDKIAFSSVVLQKNPTGWTVYGNSQNNAYFVTQEPVNNGNYDNITVLNQKVKVNKDHSAKEILVPYGTMFYSTQEVAQFLMSYSSYLKNKGMIFDKIEDGIEINWNLMVQEFLYWVQTGWEDGSIITLNPAAIDMTINKDGSIVQPLTVQQQNFILNQDLYPIQINNICVNREGTKFHVHTLNEGDTMAYAQFNVSNFEHGIVFDNTTLFNDTIYNLTTGLRQSRITLRGTKTAEWNGTVDTWGFILNQDNVQDWTKDLKYPKGIIVKYKNKYYTALRLVEPSSVFNELDWKLVNYQDIQKGLLPNSATRAYESTLYYNSNETNLENDADLLSFSLIGYRPRDYLALADLTDVTQINVYKNLIKNKGTRNATLAFQGANLPQGGIQYEVYENWAIKSGEYGGVLNDNFVEFRLDQNVLTGNPSIVSLNNGTYTTGSMQEVSVNNLYNYSQVITDPNILSTTDSQTTDILYPSAGYANFDDVKMSSYYYAGLPNAVNKSGQVVNIQNFYVRDYFWLANFKEKWGVYTWKPIGQVISATGNVNGTTTIRFANYHNLKKLDPISIINFAPNVDGYYIVADVVNLNEIIVNLNLTNANNSTTIQGRGIGLQVLNQRVQQPSDINDLSLLDAEFIKNKVWVDENTDGNWAVYRKNNNYQRQGAVYQDNSSVYGSSVAYDQNVGYLVGDPGVGKVYRYYYNTVDEKYDTSQILTETTSFGSAITHAGNTFVISQPTGTPKVYVYVWNDTTATNNLVTYQEIDAPAGVTDWGSTIEISDNQNWLYISDHLNTKVHVYRKDSTEYTAGYFVVGQTYTITSVGTTDFESIGAPSNQVGITFVATGTGSGTGTATRVTYDPVNIIDGATLGLTNADGFGKSIASDYLGDCVFIAAPNKDHVNGVTDNGIVYFYQRSTQNFEAQYTTVAYQPHFFTLAWTPNTSTVDITATNETNGQITLSSVSGISVNDAIVFTGTGLTGTGIEDNKTYYVNSIVGSNVTIKESRSSSTASIVATKSPITGATATTQNDPLYVTVNGKLVSDNNYAVIGNTFIYSGYLRAGDIVNVSGTDFFLSQSFNAATNDRINIQFGYGLDVNNAASELLIGSPYEINEEVKEGKVYRYTDGGARFGVVVGTSECNVLSPTTVVINGFAVQLQPGNASSVAAQINETRVPNINAAATAENTLIVQLVDVSLAQVNQKLRITAFDATTLSQMGISTYELTQVITCPHNVGPTEFGKRIKFNQYNSVLISAPVGANVVGTTFDFTDDENLDNDTVFDNNATRFVESYANAGAVYMFDLLTNYNGSILNPGAFVYAQSVNSETLNFDLSPYYGDAIDFDGYNVIVGAPRMQGSLLTGGEATTFVNPLNVANWSVYRQSAPIVDINKIENTQIFSAITNNTLINLDYMDPLQGKLLGAVRQNIDYVSSDDPASYNSDTATNSGYLWGELQIGQIWFNTKNVRFINYHQNDLVYNSEYWGAVFPGSDVAVYTWVASNVPPAQYQGPGIPYDITQYAIGSTINASNVVTPIYFFWARNTNLISRKREKTLSDTIIASYISNPKASGISYMAPLLPNTFALYNSEEYFEANNSIMHIGYASGISDDVSHSEFTLIRENYADDFLPGLPAAADSPVTLPGRILYPTAGSNEPYSLYARMIDSLSGCNTAGGVVPDPFLPKDVQSGILARPRQSFFFNRFKALENYLSYANEVLIQYPIAELRPNLTFANTSSEFFDVSNYWNYVNWWAPGYSDSTRATLQVPLYADLVELTVAPGTIVRVEQNGQGLFEVYRYDGNNVWTRIGLENGTFQISSSLWNYSAAKLGYSGDFFDTTPFDTYPSEETRNIIRALNEQIYTGDLTEHRNKSLILLFEYIQSEANESQNFLPWLSKTSLMDVAHTVRELKPYEVFKSDNVAFLEGYINEAKPYHVVMKEFLVKYTGSEEFAGDFTDFDLPATYNTSYQEYITPQLVFTEPENQYQYNTTSEIWSTPSYTQWYQNYGLTITGQPNYNITTLKSYMDLGSRTMIVDNASGFPTNGVIRINGETIAYTYVDRDLNLLGGLSRGFQQTVVEQHIPGDPIYIDLPAVVVLNGGNGYTDIPKVTAVIDTTKYPAPRREAVLQAVMSGDIVSAVNVIDPGDGYAVLPDIVIDSAYTVVFSSVDINSTLHTINLYAPSIQTGDLVKFRAGSNGGKPNNLVNNQWYYVGVLESLPSITVALYNSYSDAVKDQNRIKITAGLATSDMSLSPGARASIVTASDPIRENNITLKFDRTTYDSQVIDWESGAFYGAFFAGDYYNSDKVSSSSISLESTEPDINNIMASAQGVALQISNVENDSQLTWSSAIRYVEKTNLTNNSVSLQPASKTFAGTASIGVGINPTTTMNVTAIDSGTVTIGTYVYGPGIEANTKIISQLSGVPGGTGLYEVSNSQAVPSTTVYGYETNAAGTTLGFYVGMPIKFVGAVVGGLAENQIYYVSEIYNDIEFSVSTVAGGPTVALTNATVSMQGLECYVGEVVDTAILTVEYPGIRQVTATETNTNKLTVPMSMVGTSGTTGLYTNLPIFFTGEVFGGIIENLQYYITTVVDEQTFTISEFKNPLTTTVRGTVSSTNLVVVDSTAGFAVNDQLIITELTGTLGTSNIISGKTYYVSQVVSPTEMTISEAVNGTVVSLNTRTGTAMLTGQQKTVKLDSATGSMTMNVSFPVSPGQVNGQLFTLYQTSGQYTNIQPSGVDYSALIERPIVATIGTNYTVDVNRIAINETDGGTFNFYVNMPIRVNTNGGGLVAGDTYYVIEYSGEEIPDPEDPTKTIVRPNISVEVNTTSSIGNTLICANDPLRGYVGTASLYEGMPIVFTGIGLGSIVIGQEYFVKNIISDIEFTISETQGGATKVISNANGIMIGTGNPYIVVSATKGGPAYSLANDATYSGFTLNQFITGTPEFDLSYMVGGYRAIITNPGSGFAIDNVITLSGALVGGNSPTNDITLIVNTIDSDGGITSVIRQGVPPEMSNKYYLQVRSPNTFAVYSNPLMTVPVSGVDFAYEGYTSSIVTGSTTDTLTVDTTGFEENDEVYFSGDVPAGLSVGVPYYLYSMTATETKLTRTPGDVSGLVTGITFSKQFSMAKLGSIALLPEPFYFNQSVVRFNNRVYVCVVSNNDSEFIFGKWELLDSGDRRLNAMDRVIGYYQPTANMPGVDLTQLFEGVTYPNSTYMGNPFQPSQQYELDTILGNLPFYPSEVDMSGAVWDGTKYIASANLPNYSAVAISEDGETWTIDKLTSSNINTTDVVYAGGVYLLTSSNPATPIFRSNNGIDWTTNGYYTPYGTDYDVEPYDITSLTISPFSLNSVAYCTMGKAWVAVGKNIIRSEDSYVWRELTDFNPAYDYNLNAVVPISGTNCRGLVAVGKGKEPDYSTGVTQLVDVNLFFYSSDSINWTQAPAVTNKGFYGVSSNGTNVIAVGEEGVIYYTQNGFDWIGLNEVNCVFVNSATNILNVTNTAGFTGGAAGTPIRFNKSFSTIVAGTTYYVKSVVSSTQVTLSTTLNGSVLTLTDASIPAGARMYVYDSSDPVPATLRNILYANNVWIAVGDSGTIKTSTDGINWTSRTSGVIATLNNVVYNAATETFTIVGENNVILTSSDNGETWDYTSVFAPIQTAYDVTGADFQFGYAPEELVAGVISDSVAIKVTTRPGTNWPVSEYGHTGFDVVSLELAPNSATQVEYSFAGAVNVPTHVNVQVISGVTGLGTTLAETEYTINWLNKTVVLNSPLAFSSVTDSLRIDVYAVGNGDQLVKASTDNTPIRTNERSGFNEIYLNCNYSAAIFQGSGVLRPGTDNINVAVFETESVSDRIFCADVSNFMLNSPITFQGVPFGGLEEETVYFVKSISYATNAITVSLFYDTVAGQAGPTLELSDATGEMFANIQNGVGAVWTDPIVEHNGTKLVFGATGLVTRSKASNNALTTATTSGLIVGTPITFCACAFGSIVPFQKYYIHSIVDSNEFTIAETPNALEPLPQIDFVGTTSYVTNDYAIGSRNGNKAKIIFATNQYSVANDYIAFTLFGESSPEQYGYALPEVQYFAGNGSTSSFYLVNFVGYDNPKNAIVEIDGVRLTASQYTISSLSNTILFNSPPPAGSTVSVTTYNDTNRQYLTSQYGITGNPGSALSTITVGSTTNSVGTFDQDTPTVQTYDQNSPSVVLYDQNLYWLTLSSGSTSSLNINDPIIFNAPTIGGIIAGETYYVTQILNSTQFVISEDVGGQPFEVTNATGSMTAVSNGLTVSPISSITNTITPPLATTFATATTAPNTITVTSVDNFVAGQTVQFFGTAFGGLKTDGTVYFIDTISTLNSTITVKDRSGTLVTVTTGTGNMSTVVGGTPAVRVTTAIDHNLSENTLVRIDGTTGSVQLNNNVYYAKIINNKTFDLYTRQYDPAPNAINYPVTTISSYTGGGYTWRQGSFFITTALASETGVPSGGDPSYITVNDTTLFVPGTPVYFSRVESPNFDENGDPTQLLGGLVQGQEYYVKDILPSANKITVSEVRNGDAVVLTNATGRINVTQWAQDNVDRIWVTVNGYRVPSSKLRMNDFNEVSILTQIVPGDQVIISSMIPTATPNEDIYINFVNASNNGTVYRINPNITTWTTSPVYPLSDIIHVDDVTKVTNQVVQNVVTPTATDGYYYVGLTADKSLIASVSVYNNTTGNLLPEASLSVVIIDLTPNVKIVPGSYINVGDSLTITTLEGNTIYVNGEQILFGRVDFINNTLSHLSRGANGTATQPYIAPYSNVYGLLSVNELPEIYYNQTWNSYNFNQIEGDPLQVSDTIPADFLNSGNT